MPNRLIHEKSPYLLQHANNPVDWYPWGDEAFAKSLAENKPIFLSVGYSTCHWCHVMERESFENDAIAAQMNRDFVCIKVDREERPDIDRIYMTYVQASTGSGGWPMSVWLTPGLRPFVGGTYFPPENRYGRAGFPTIMERIATAWRSDREKIEESSLNILGQLQDHLSMEAGGIDESALESGFQYWRRHFDFHNAGFGEAPKFPRPVTLNFLLRYWARTKNQEALDMVVKTLKAMARGGMNDQLGGGFHRYSVDEYWFVPHFEKMLYDQAQLVIAYTEAYQATLDPELVGPATATLDYVLHDGMTHPDGGFFSAEDADSVSDPEHPHEKGEGAFYIWTYDEVVKILGDDAAKIFCFRYGVHPEGNVQNDPHQEFGGHNILFEANSLAETAHHFGIDPAALEILDEEQRDSLFDARALRIRPHLDDKVLTAWNGLMISAFARAGAVWQRPDYLGAARRAADFVASRMRTPDGGLLRRYREGDAAVPGFLDDYAAFVQGLIDLYESTFHAADLSLAESLTRKMIELFEDREAGGFFSTAGGDPSLILRLKDDYDGAEPAGNSIAALNLLRLAAITGNREFEDVAHRTLEAFAKRMATQPAALPQMLVAYEWSIGRPMQVILAGDRDAEATRSMTAAVHRRFLPHRVLALAQDAGEKALGLTPVDGKTTAYLCENFACQLPVNDPEKFEKQLNELLK